MRRPPDDEYPLWLLIFGISLFVVILILIGAFLNRIGATTLDRLADERRDYYEAYAHLDVDACGPYRRVCWWAIRDLGFGPLATDHRTGTTRLRSLDCLLRAESRLDPDAIGRRAHIGVDRGIAQINSWYNDHITDAQAFDPHWSIRWTARHLFTVNRVRWWGWEDNCCKPALARAVGDDCRTRST